MKKLLALVLALVMTLGLATVSASADYADQSSIKHTEAVEILTSLGVVTGKDTGNFDPTGEVKRSEMAKMVMIAQLGSATKAENFKGAQTPLTDIDGTWGEGFIKYCYSQGIIAGKSETEFKPSDKVTATEAAKMLLVAIGYNADVQGYKGSTWKVAVNRDASIKRFFTNLEDLGADDYLNREQAAQMVYNAMDATMIEKTSEIGRATGEVVDKYADYGDHRDLLGDAFRAFIYEGLLDRFSYASKDGKWKVRVNNAPVIYNSAKDNDLMRITQIRPSSQSNADPYGSNGLVANGNYTFDVFEDVSDLYMQKVKVLYQLDKNYRVDKALGIYAEDSMVVASGKLGDIDVPNAGADMVKIDGTNYDLTENSNLIRVYEYTYNTSDPVNCTNGDLVLSDLNVDMNAAAIPADPQSYYTKNTTAAGNSGARQAWSFKLIDFSGDDKGDCVVVYPAAVGKVTGVSTSTVTVQWKLSVIAQPGFNNISLPGGTSFQRKDADIYDGIARNDYVLVTPKSNTSTDTAKIEKLDYVTGTVSSTKSDKELIDGDWFNSKFLSNNAKAGDKVSYVAYNGYIVDQDGASLNDAEDFVVVTDAATTGNNKLGGALAAKLLKFDGTKQTLDIKEVNGAAADSSNLQINRMYILDTNSDGDYVLFDVNRDHVFSKNAATDATSSKANGTWDDDEYKTAYETVKAWNSETVANGALGAGAGNHTYVFGNDTYGGRYVASKDNRQAYYEDGTTFTIADDAVIYVSDSNDNGKVKKTTGAQFKKNTTAADIAFYAANKNDETGYNEIKLAYVSIGGGITTKKDYAFALADAVTKQDSDGKWFVELTVWDGDEVVTMTTKTESSTNASIIKDASKIESKDAFSYELTASGTLDKVERKTVNGGVVTANGNPKALAITAYQANAIVEVSSEVFYKNSGVVTANTAPNFWTYTYDITNDTEIFYVDLSGDATGMTDGSVSTVSKETLDSLPNGGAHYVANAIVIPNPDAGHHKEAAVIIVDVSGDMLGVR